MMLALWYKVPKVFSCFSDTHEVLSVHIMEFFICYEVVQNHVIQNHKQVSWWRSETTNLINNYSYRVSNIASFSFNKAGTERFYF